MLAGVLSSVPSPPFLSCRGAPALRGLQGPFACSPGLFFPRATITWREGHPALAPQGLYQTSRQPRRKGKGRDGSSPLHCAVGSCTRRSLWWDSDGDVEFIGPIALFR